MRKGFGVFTENEMFWLFKRVLDAQSNVRASVEEAGSNEYMQFLESIRVKLHKEIWSDDTQGKA